MPDTSRRAASQLQYAVGMGVAPAGMVCRSPTGWLGPGGLRGGPGRAYDDVCGDVAFNGQNRRSGTPCLTPTA